MGDEAGFWESVVFYVLFGGALLLTVVMLGCASHVTKDAFLFGWSLW